MKRLAIIVVMALMSLTASANSVRYFTLPQAQRTVRYLDAQNELMLYCGYDYEIETYVLINEVWMERVNSAYYEIWVYGYDAYTGDEIIMPLDLQCVWLYSAGRMYNAAQYLRFHATVRHPGFNWYIPPYNPFTRRPHYAGYVRTYHYNVHCHGWMPPTPPPHGYGPHTQPPLPPYYMRTPQTPPPAPTTTWTPGIEHPSVSTPTGTTTHHSTLPTTRPADNSSSTARPGGTTTRGDSGTTTTRGTGTTTTRSSEGTTTTRSSEGTTTTRGTGTTPTRTNTGTTTRTSENNNSGTTTRGSSTSGTTTRGSSNSGTTTRGSSTSGTTTRGSGNTGTTTRGSSNTGTTTRGSSNTNSSTTRGTTTENPKTTRGTSTR